MPLACAQSLISGRNFSSIGSNSAGRDGTSASTIQRMIDKCFHHSPELRKQPLDARFDRFDRTFWMRASGGVSARQPSFSSKILTNRGQHVFTDLANRA
jgi:hypothetical protein